MCLLISPGDGVGQGRGTTRRKQAARHERRFFKQSRKRFPINSEETRRELFALVTINGNLKIATCSVITVERHLMATSELVEKPDDRR